MRLKLTDRQQTLLYIVCLAVWVAMINAGRGSGIDGLKWFQIAFMIWGAWKITYNWWAVFFYSGMCLAMFWIGTGELMPIFNQYYDNWRFWEMALGAGWTLIYFIPPWLSKKI